MVVDSSSVGTEVPPSMALSFATFLSRAAEVARVEQDDLHALSSRSEDL
jgi:hypothetical protein